MSKRIESWSKKSQTEKVVWIELPVLLGMLGYSLASKDFIWFNVTFIIAMLAIVISAIGELLEVLNRFFPK